MRWLIPVCVVMTSTGAALLFVPASSFSLSISLILYGGGWILWGLTAGPRLRKRDADRLDPPAPDETRLDLAPALRRERLIASILLIVGSFVSCMPMVGLLGIPIVVGALLAMISTALVELPTRPLPGWRRALGAILLIIGWIAATGTAMQTAQFLVARLPGSSLLPLGVWWLMAPALVALGLRLRVALAPRERLARGVGVATVFLGTALTALALSGLVPSAL